MPEGTLTGSPAPSQDGDSTGQPVEQRPATVEETEAFWRNRFSARDRAHNAETAALKAQMDALQQRASQAPPPPDESPEAARVRELESALQQEKAARFAESLKGKYPTAGSVLGDAITGLPEEKVAAIEALVGGGESATPRVIDPNAAPRQGAPAAKPTNEKSKEELLGDLRKIAPAYQQALREGLL